MLKTSGRPAASPISIGSSSSRLLSSKLVTVPSKNSTSPLPSGSAGAPITAAASPWAKPAVPVISLAEAQDSSVQHPTSTRTRGSAGLGPPAMGSGAGIGLGSAKPAWRAVSGDGRRIGGGSTGLSRDFPTANEVAEGE
jgi:hypothetical protein